MSLDSQTNPFTPPITTNSLNTHGTSTGGVFPKRSAGVPMISAQSVDETHFYIIEEFHKRSTAEELIEKILDTRAEIDNNFANCSKDDFELFDTMGTLDGRTYRERKMDPTEYPVIVKTLWPRGPLNAQDNDPSIPRNRFVLKSKKRLSSDQSSLLLATASTIDTFLTKFLSQPKDREYADLCVLPELTEQTLLDNLRDRFKNGKIYTYIGPILVAVNPFNFLPIYNPKYSRLYCQNRRLGALPPHVFAIADVTYHNLIRNKENQVVVISGESGSGKTESTNFLLHHLTALSQKGTQGHTIEQQILNYHVFYYLLEGMTDSERKDHLLLNAKDYYYLNQNSFFACESLNEKHEFERLKHSMTAVGFSTQSQHKIFGTISAVLLLGNIEYKKLRPGFHSDESAFIENEELVSIVSGMLCICAQQLTQALTMRRTVLKHDVVVNRYSLAEATQTRDALAKCLYNALFHWIVLRINHSLFRKESATANKSNGLYIGILDIFGFEDVGGNCNSFEQLCINYANERLQAYFNQHIFQFEQEIYMKENIRWTPIQYTDNTECVEMFSSKPYGLLRLVDERESAFIIAHYAGKVKYQIYGFREKNKDLMRHDVMNVLKGSKSAFVRELVGEDPVAVFRWSLLRCTVRAMFAFRQAGRTKLRAGSVDRLELTTAQTPSMARRSSDSHLNAFLRGELPASIVPDFCDISVFKTIKERARKTPTKSHSLRLSYLKTLQALKGAVGQKAISNKPSSVSRQFGASLSRLMKTLGQATPYFIRCIKSNNEKVPNHFDDNIILRQLRYTGMLETVRIRRAGYSVRIEYESFVNQYRILLPKGLASTKSDIQEFMRCIPIIDSEENIQYGNTKIFMRDPEKLLLDDHLHRIIMEKILTLQRWIRAQLEHKRYKKFRAGALTRGVLSRIKMQRKHAAVICIQSWWRKIVAQRNLEERRASKENKSSSPRPMITRLVKTTLPKLDINDPESLAAFASPDSFDSRELDDELLLSIGEEEESDEDEEEEEEEGERLEEEMFELDDEKLAKHKREHPELALDADFILEDARLKLIQSHSYEAKRKMMQRRQSLAATSARKHKMLRRAASTESDQIQDSSYKAKVGILVKVPQRLFNLDSNSSKECDKLRFHQFKPSRVCKTDKCATCNRQMTGILMVQGLRCTGCRLIFHKDCANFATKIPCTTPLTSPNPVYKMSEAGRRPWERMSFKSPRLSLASTYHGPLFGAGFTAIPSFNLTKTKQQTDSTALLIESIDDLREFSVFIFKKQSHLGQQNKRETESMPLEGFSMNLWSRESEEARQKRIHNGHQFSLDYVHIPTYCEICNVFMWHAERIFVCFACRLSCHKKCHSRVNYVCPKANNDQPTCSKFFGTDLANLLADDEVPALLNKLLNCVEVKALFVEGIYRKSGQMAVFKGIRKKIETIKEPEAINFDDIPIHVLTSLIKAFFRELSEPLIIPDLYENFVNISEIKETNERVRCLRAMMDMLPKGNKCVLDRLMYHLARVAHQESVNKMSASNLAAICVQTLIEDKLHHLQETLSQIVELEGATEKVTENLRRIEEHRRASTGTMIPTLSSTDSTTNENKDNLITPKISTTTKIISTNLNNNEEEEKNNLTKIAQEKEKNIETAKQLFEEQLDFLDKEKAKLIQELPPLAPVASSEDLSSDDVDNSGESLRSQNSIEEYALDLSVPPVVALLHHACKSRPSKGKGMRRPSINFIRKWRSEVVNNA
uniref:Uncharacterized protein n=1 Tax=Meloidogyne floridensis TaxID=298350 RepID=A0A915P0B4_9BILA